MFVSIVSTESNLADLIDEFLDSPFMGDDQFAVTDFFAQAFSREGTAEDDFMRVLGDVDETATAGDAVFELTDIDIAFGVTFSHAQESHVQPAAIVKVELIRMVDDCIGVGRSAKVSAAGRYTANRSGFDSQCQLIADTFFIGYTGDAFRNPDAQVDDGVGYEFHRSPAGNDLTGVECHRRNLGQRHTHFTGIGRVLDLTDLGQDDVVDVDARLAAGNAAEPLSHRTLRQVVAFDLVVHDQFTQFGSQVIMTGNDPFQHAFMGEMAGTFAHTVTDAGCMDQCQLLRISGLGKAVFQCLQYFFR